MAVRITHQNNSSGHDGTYVYRSTSPMDPQNLPAPIADAPPATGATFEYIDSPADGTYYYRTQDHEGGQVSDLSAEASITIGDDYSSAQVGDEIGGGIYAGTITYADARQFHIVFAKQSGEASALQWGNYPTTTGATDPDDGKANQDQILASYDNGDSEAFYHCRDYVDGMGNDDYYLPARNEIALADALVAMSHAEFSSNLTAYRYSSTEFNSDSSWSRKFSDGAELKSFKYQTREVRPIRRVPV